MTMSDRPTPEQIAATEGVARQNTLDLLAHHGFVIVHPDDHPPVDDSYLTDDFARGVNAALRDVFGEGDA